jgi:ATP adenylyltransferase
MAFMADLIHCAATDCEAALCLEDKADEVRRLFGNEEGLLLSLRQRWMTMLTAKLDQADYDNVSAEQARADLAAAHEGLRALLDAAARRSVRVHSLADGEQHILDLYADPLSAQKTIA